MDWQRVEDELWNEKDGESAIFEVSFLPGQTENTDSVCFGQFRTELDGQFGETVGGEISNGQRGAVRFRVVRFYHGPCAPAKLTDDQITHFELGRLRFDYSRTKAKKR